MTTDHDIIARACRLAGIRTLYESGIYLAWVGEVWLHFTHPALRALLVLRLQDATGASITPADTLRGRGWHIGRLKREGGATVLTHIDIIRVLVDALEGEG